MLQAATGAAAALTPAEQTWQTIAADLESGAAEAECPQVSLGLGFGFGLGLGLANPNPSPSPSANPSPNPNPDPNQCCSDPSGCVFRVRPLDVRGWSRPGSASAPAFPASAPSRPQPRVMRVHSGRSTKHARRTPSPHRARHRRWLPSKLASSRPPR